MKVFKNKKVLIWILIILGVISVIFSVFYMFMPHMKINGKENMTIKLNTKYTEKGVSYQNIFGQKGKKVEINGKVDNTKIGTYEIKYVSNYLFFPIKRIRKVTVVDDIKPIIIKEFTPKYEL